MEEWMENARREILNTILTMLPFFALAAGAPILGIVFADNLPHNESMNTWFQRSGSIMVAAVIGIEAQVAKISPYIWPSGIITSYEQRIIDEFRFRVTVIKWAGLIIAFLGTFIWGYGDMIMGEIIT